MLAAQPEEVEHEAVGELLCGPTWPLENGGMCGDFPPLESYPEEGIPDPFLLPCQVSFLQHRLNFLPPACPALRVGTGEWSLPGGEAAPAPRVTDETPNRHPGPQGGLYWMGKGLNLL